MKKGIMIFLTFNPEANWKKVYNFKYTKVFIILNK